uniref:Uncharacterized protein n=1 Tax=Meloidogyne incognita TaxID=6306 RepID=A0A914NI58_MELIC
MPCKQCLAINASCYHPRATSYQNRANLKTKIRGERMSRAIFLSLFALAIAIDFH